MSMHKFFILFSVSALFAFGSTFPMNTSSKASEEKTEAPTSWSDYAFGGFSYFFNYAQNPSSNETLTEKATPFKAADIEPEKKRLREDCASFAPGSLSNQSQDEREPKNKKQKIGSKIGSKEILSQDAEASFKSILDDLGIPYDAIARDLWSSFDLADINGTICKILDYVEKKPQPEQKTYSEKPAPEKQQQPAIGDKRKEYLRAVTETLSACGVSKDVLRKLPNELFSGSDVAHAPQTVNRVFDFLAKNPKMQEAKSAQSIRLSNKEDERKIGQAARSYPIKLLGNENGKQIDHKEIDKNQPSQGLLNVNGNDCFLASSFQVLNQMGPLIDLLEEMYVSQKTNDFQNEIIAFMRSLRGDSITYEAYAPNKNATAVMRSFLVGHVASLRGMRSGQHDALEFLSGLLDELIGDNQNLADIVCIKENSTLSLSDEVYKSLHLFDSNVARSSHKQELMRLLPLGICQDDQTYDSLQTCLDSFFGIESNVEILSWKAYGQDISLGTYGLPEVNGTKKLSLKQPLPKILMIQLKRFSMDFETGQKRKNSDPISFPVELDMARYCGAPGELKYMLRGFIVHIGNDKSGHYWACAKDRFDNQWYVFNDSLAVQITETLVRKIANTGNVENILQGTKAASSSGNPYMLFYERG